MEENPASAEQEPLAAGRPKPALSSAMLTVASVFFVYLFYQSGGALLAAWASELAIDHAAAITQGLAQLLFLLLPTIVLMRLSAIPAKVSMRLEGSVTLSQYILGIAGILAIQVFASGFVPLQDWLLPDSWRIVFDQLSLEIEGMYRRMLAGETPADTLRALVVGAVIPAFTEELLFRGYLQRHLEERMPAHWAIGLTALLFGLFHLNPISFVPLTLIGAFLGYIAWHTQSLALPFFLHFFNNAISIVALFLSKSLDPFTAEGEQLDPVSALWLSLWGFGTLAITMLLLRRRRA